MMGPTATNIWAVIIEPTDKAKSALFTLYESLPLSAPHPGWVILVTIGP